MTETQSAPAAPAISVVPNLDPLDLIEFRRGQTRRREFRPIGKLEKIVFEKQFARQRPIPHSAEDVRRENLKRHHLSSLDWLNTGPLIGLTPDDQDVLVITGMRRPPDLPDPDWDPRDPITGRIAPVAYKDGFPIPPKPGSIPQRLRDRMAGKCEGRDGETWLVFQPLTQILVILQNRQGLGLIQFSADETGRHGALLFDPSREEGHILFGRKVLELRTIGAPMSQREFLRRL